MWQWRLSARNFAIGVGCVQFVVTLLVFWGVLTLFRATTLQSVEESLESMCYQQQVTESAATWYAVLWNT